MSDSEESQQSATTTSSTEATEAARTDATETTEATETTGAARTDATETTEATETTGAARTDATETTEASEPTPAEALLKKVFPEEAEDDEEESEEDAARAAAYEELFRNEGIISEAALRVSVTRDFSRAVYGDDSISLSSSSVRTRGDYSADRVSRNRHVHGNYEQVVWGNESYNMDYAGYIEEIVEGGVYQKAGDITAIMSGTYVNTIVGPYMMVGGWMDYLIWGGWMEADTIRVEVAGGMMRVYIAFSQVSGAHISVIGRLMDDYGLRSTNEGFKKVDSKIAQAIGTLPGTNVKMQV